jgi:hypothetical protein
MGRVREKVVKLKEENGIVYFKAIFKLSDEEHKNLSDKLRYEAEKSGLNIVLIPASAALTNAKGE